MNDERGKTYADIISEVINKYGLKIVVILGIVIAIGWISIHMLGEPGKKISFLYGLIEYEKSQKLKNDTKIGELKKEIDALNEQIKNKDKIIADLGNGTEGLGSEISDVPSLKNSLRSDPKNDLSIEEVRIALQNNNLFDSILNRKAKGIENRFIEDRKKLTVKDEATGLIWEQSGSVTDMNYEDAKKHVVVMNNEAYAGYKDWRLPTLEEAMSLMETKKKHGDLYISELFDKTQRWIWTADKKDGSVAWVVDFIGGDCDYGRVGDGSHVRAVR
jgi:hypothetical protein